MEQCEEYSPVDKERRLFDQWRVHLMTKIRDGRSCFYYDGPLRDINHLVESNRAINVEREGSRILALDNGESRMLMLRVKYS